MDKNSLLIRFIRDDEVHRIFPLLSQLNQDTETEILNKRVIEMFKENYQCLGIFTNHELIGICGLWTMTRHYCGKSLEPDHVVIDEKYRNIGIGKVLFEWIFNYARQNGYEATELNSYLRNTGSHKFYQELGYEIKGYHFVKVLD